MSVPGFFEHLATGVPGLAWPAVPAANDAVTLALFQQLDRIQWWTAQRIAASQRRQLEALLQHALQHVPYYRDRARGTLPGSGSGAFKWQDLPLLGRVELRQNEARLRSDTLPAGHGTVGVARTSGSSGMPVHVLKASILHSFMAAYGLREIDWHGMDTSLPVAAIRVARQPPEAARLPGLRQRGWGLGASALAASGESFLLHIECTMDDQLQFLAHCQPAYLITYPSNLAALLTLLERRPFAQRMPGLRSVKCVGELVTDELRARCREVLKVPLIDEYSSQEAGPTALQCPRHDHYHVHAESVLVEVLDDNNRPCRPGEVGRVIVTPLQNFAMPLLRYDIGDFAEVGAACDCGRGLPVLRRIIGRERSMISYPDGSKRWPLGGDRKYRDLVPLIQYQFVQTSLMHFDVNLVVERPLTPAEEAALADWIKTSLKYPFDLTFHYHNEIPRGPGGKFQDYVSMID